MDFVRELNPSIAVGFNQSIAGQLISAVYGLILESVSNVDVLLVVCHFVCALICKRLISFMPVSR